MQVGAVKITTLSCVSSTGSPDILCATMSSKAASTAMPSSAQTSLVRACPSQLLIFSSCDPCDSSHAPHFH